MLILTWVLLTANLAAAVPTDGNPVRPQSLGLRALYKTPKKFTSALREFCVIQLNVHKAKHHGVFTDVVNAQRAQTEFLMRFDMMHDAPMWFANVVGWCFCDGDDDCPVPVASGNDRAAFEATLYENELPWVVFNVDASDIVDMYEDLTLAVWRIWLRQVVAEDVQGGAQFMEWRLDTLDRNLAWAVKWLLLEKKFGNCRTSVRMLQKISFSSLIGCRAFFIRPDSSCSNRLLTRWDWAVNLCNGEDNRYDLQTARHNWQGHFVEDVSELDAEDASFFEAMVADALK